MHAAVVPHPPLLAPGLTGPRTTAPASRLRDAALTAVRELLDGDPPVLVCVGPGASTTRHPSTSWGTLAGYGTPVDAPSGRGPGRPILPLSLTVARLLLEAAGWQGSLVLQEVGHREPPDACAALGAGLAAELPSARWLVLGDGSSTRATGAPDAVDERAALLDDRLGRALAGADPRALAAMDAGVAAEVGAYGRAAWQVLAGALQAGGGRCAGEVLLDEAPFGVRYVVARWRPA